MAGFGVVFVVVLDNLVEELVEGLVRVVGASVSTNAGVDVLASREDAHLEGDTTSIMLVFVLIPDFLGEVLGDKRARLVLGEEGPVDEIVNGFEPGTAVGPALDGGRLGQLGTIVCVFGLSAAHKLV